MKKLFLTFALLMFSLVAFSDEQGGGTLPNVGGGNGKACLYSRGGSTDGKIYCGICLIQDVIWDSGYTC